MDQELERVLSKLDLKILLEQVMMDYFIYGRYVPEPDR